MTGVDTATGPGPDPGDERVDDWGPPPWRSPLARLVDRVTGPLRPWITWFGPRRLLGGAVTVVVAVGVGWWLVRPADLPTEARLPYASSGPTTVAGGVGAAPAGSAGPSVVVSAPTSTAPTVIVVHVAGAVGQPGVVELPAGARVADALGPAGGARPDADLAAINLAAVVLDGQQVYVPTVGEERPPPAPPASPIGGSSTAPVGPVDVNRATVSELDGLPGIGPATAAAIVAHRDLNGPFASVDDLEQVRGIGPAKLDALRPLVTT